MCALLLPKRGCPSSVLVAAGTASTLMIKTPWFELLQSSAVLFYVLVFCLCWAVSGGWSMGSVRLFVLLGLLVFVGVHGDATMRGVRGVRSGSTTDEGLPSTYQEYRRAG